MRKIFMSIATLLLVLTARSAVAQTVLSGDARLRPRMDLKDNGAYGNSSADGYYYYRARLNIKSTLGDGWFSHVQLGTAGFGYWTGKFGDTEASQPSAPHSSSIDGAYRGPVSFMLIYFGRQTDRYGFYGGLIPVNGFSNPILDIHYYSDRMIDVPFYLFSNNGAHGFAVYKTIGSTKVMATVLVDNNDGIKIKKSDGIDSVNTKDQYTLMIDAPIKIGEATIQPVMMMTMADTDRPAPVTLGANLISPEIGIFTFSGSLAFSSQSKGTTDLQYSAWLARAKVVSRMGQGALTVWIDLAAKTRELQAGIPDIKHRFAHLRFSYQIPIYQSNNGSVSIKPTWRHMVEKVNGPDDLINNQEYVENKDYARDKIEVTIDFKFK